MNDDKFDIQNVEVTGVNQTPGLCGPASLKAVLGFFGINIELSELAEKSKATKEDGVKSEGLLQAANIYGFDGEIKDNSSISELRSVIKSGIPVIVDWWKNDDGHYSVVTDINNTELKLMDPESGSSVWINLDEFNSLWFDFPIGDLEHQNPINKCMIVIKPKTKNSIAEWKEYLENKSIKIVSTRDYHNALRTIDNFIASHAPAAKGMIWRNGKVNPNASVTDVNAALILIAKFGQANLDDLGDPSDSNRLSGTPMNSMFISQEDSKLDEWSPGNNQNQSQTGSTTPKNINFSGKKRVSKIPEIKSNINERMIALTDLLNNVKK
jgi:hypothetical protein